MPPEQNNIWSDSECLFLEGWPALSWCIASDTPRKHIVFRFDRETPPGRNWTHREVGWYLIFGVDAATNIGNVVVIKESICLWYISRIYLNQRIPNNVLCSCISTALAFSTPVMTFSSLLTCPRCIFTHSVNKAQLEMKPRHRHEVRSHSIELFG